VFSPWGYNVDHGGRVYRTDRDTGSVDSVNVSLRGIRPGQTIYFSYFWEGTLGCALAAVAPPQSEPGLARSP
jgi:hypothetical protein